MADTIDNNQTGTEISQTTTSETVTETQQIPIEKIEEYKECKECFCFDSN